MRNEYGIAKIWISIGGACGTSNYIASSKNQSTYEIKLERFRMFGIIARVTVFITTVGAVEVIYEIMNNALHNIIYFTHSWS
jgi:hypothetical protein